ncbi:MAG TPA: BTAD domain-containing putative transcriptional regulator [Blastocatellia bacterium]|nr:BTAD domain-containing putative transcriptional regulator [Blastocatellia bacterium]
MHHEQILEALWSDHDPAQAARNLYRAIHSARRALEPEPGVRSHFILNRERHVILQAPRELRVDVAVFEQRAGEALEGADPSRYEAALEVYAGDLLPEDPYEDWATLRREQLSALRRSLPARLAGIYEKGGQYQRSIERLKELVACDPVNEEAHRQLMRLYALTGERHQALQQYRLCAETIRREISVVPEPATTELYERIVSGEIQPLHRTRESEVAAPLTDPNQASEPDIDTPVASAELIVLIPSGAVADAAQSLSSGLPDLSPALPIEDPVQGAGQSEGPGNDFSQTPEVIEAMAGEHTGAQQEGDPVRAAARVGSGRIIPRSRRVILRFALTSVIAVLLAVAGVALYNLKLRGKVLSLTLQDKAIDSIAVLPFTNEGADRNTDYLGDGIAESIINSLSSLTRLRVTAWSTVLSYKGKKMDARAIGRELGVKAVLTGRMLQQGDGLVIAAELVDVADGSQIWGERYNRKLSDIIALQTEISWEISQMLRLSLSREEQRRLTKRHTQNTEAYQLYLRGRYYWNKRNTEGVYKAIEHFEQAVRQDPNFALAWAGLADCYAVCPDDEGMLPQEKWAKAKAAAARAVETDGALAEAHTSLAFVRMIQDWDLPGARVGFERAIALNPSYATAHHWYAYDLAALEQPGGAISEIKRALELDPVSLPINADLAEFLLYARQYDRAIEQCRKTLELDPNFIPAHLNPGLACQQKGMFEEAVSELKQTVTLSKGNAYLVAQLGNTYAAAGRLKEARAILADLEKRAPRKYLSPYYEALIHAQLGERDRAFVLLEKARRERVFSALFLDVDPRLDGLRSDPRYTELLRRIRLW